MSQLVDARFAARVDAVFCLRSAAGIRAGDGRSREVRRLRARRQHLLGSEPIGPACRAASADLVPRAWRSLLRGSVVRRVAAPLADEKGRGRPRSNRARRLHIQRARADRRRVLALPVGAPLPRELRLGHADGPPVEAVGAGHVVPLRGLRAGGRRHVSHLRLRLDVCPPEPVPRRRRAGGEPKGRRRRHHIPRPCVALRGGRPGVCEDRDRPPGVVPDVEGRGPGVGVRAPRGPEREARAAHGHGARERRRLGGTPAASPVPLHHEGLVRLRVPRLMLLRRRRRLGREGAKVACGRAHTLQPASMNRVRSHGPEPCQKHSRAKDSAPAVGALGCRPGPSPRCATRPGPARQRIKRARDDSCGVTKPSIAGACGN